MANVSRLLLSICIVFGIAGLMPVIAQEPFLPPQALERVTNFFEARRSARYMEQDCHATTYPASAQTGEFNQPWQDERIAIVIDPFQGNEIVWAQVASDPRVVGVIHRATIGARKDTKYAQRKAEALERGFKWGSYHLGKPGNPIVQADFYLETVRPSADEVIALDIESLNSETDMSLANARKFIQRIREKTGRFPMLYANQAVVKHISAKFGRDDVFAKTPLWYARFKARVTDFPTKTWDSYTLWQFSSEINCKPAHPENCLHRVPGTRTDMDINVYRGTIEELKANWPFKRE